MAFPTAIQTGSSSTTCSVRGDTYTAEKAILQKTGEFVYQPLDGIRDGLTRNGETVTRAGGAANLGAGAVGVVGGGVIAGAGAVSCIETLGLGCVAVPIGVGIAGVSNQQMQQGNSALFGSYQSGEGQRVLDSFNLATYPGERDPLMLIGIDAAKFGLAYVGGKYIPKALAKAEGLGTGGANGGVGVLADIQATLTQKVGDLRAALTGSAKTSGNMGIAQIDIAGIQPTMAASSQIAQPTAGQRALGFIGEVPETFPSSVVPTAIGYPLNRAVDSEAKILNNIAAQLGENRSATGTINLLTERAPCSSCSNVIQQFQSKYPNIKINVMDNGGVIPPTKKEP